MNQKTIIAILGVVAIILVGTTIYYVNIDKVCQPIAPTLEIIQQTSPTPKTQQPTQPPTAQTIKTTPNNQNYIEIKELGFKITVDAVMANEITYKIDGTTAQFSTKTLNAINKYCKDGAGGTIQKVIGTPANPAIGSPEYYQGRMADIKQFPGFFLAWAGPQATCTDNNHDLEVKAIQTVKNGFKNVSLTSQ